MTARTFAIVGLRLLGVYVLIQGLQTLALMVFFFALGNQLTSAGYSQGPPIAAAICDGVVLLVMAVMLLFGARRIACYLLPPVADEIPRESFSLSEIEALAFGVAGLIILFNALPAVVRTVVIVSRDAQVQPGAPNRGEAIWNALLPSGGCFLQLLLGFFLIFSPRALANAWHWLRTAGTGAKLPPSSDTPA